MFTPKRPELQEYVFMPLALVALQVLAVGRLLRTRESLKPLSGRESALKSHFYVRLKNPGYKSR